MDGMIRRFACLRILTVALLVIPTAGCIGLAAQTLYVLKGHKNPAKFDGLKKKRVAIVCVSDSESMGSDSVTVRISQLVTAQLLQQVKGIEIVPHSDIKSWQDSNSWEKLDYAEVGRGVNAEMVLAIEISSYSLDEGATMFKGRSEITTFVFDMEKNGSQVFTQGPEQFTFPRNGRPKMQTSQREFENKYLAKLSIYISQNFFKQDRFEAVENDSSF